MLSPAIIRSACHALLLFSNLQLGLSECTIIIYISGGLLKMQGKCMPVSDNDFND